MIDSLNIDSIESLYKALSGQNEIKTKAILILMLRNWLTEVSSFDPVSGHALHTGIIDLMNVVAKSGWDESPESEIKDRIYRIVSHTKEAVLAIMEHTRDKILREYAMLPIHAAREVDSNSVQWLSRQPGRTLREKLSGRPYMKAVRRRSSVDTAENRLLRAFLFRLEQILIARQNVLATATEDTCEELLVSLQRWLRTEDAAEIGAWGNLPPNNTLLQDKRYRKVWGGWLWLQAIDEQITEDSKRVHRDILSVIYWNTLSLLNHSGRCRTVQQPVGLDYDNFAIFPELPVRGYLFPACDSSTELSGTIDRLVTDRGFGFIDGYFFHASDLQAGLRFDELQLGDQLLFEVEETSKGKCAKRLKKGVHTSPKQIAFKLLNEKIDISVDEETISILIDGDKIILTQKNKGVKKKLKIEPAALKEIPKTILSLVTDSPFEYPESTNNQSAPIRMDSSIVDLCSIRPTFTNNTGSQAHLPFRLLQQHWPLTINGGVMIDCGYAKSIALNPNIETVSIRSLFSHNSTLSDATKSSASMFFIKKLSDYLTADKLTYLVPDWGNDFDLESVRKSVNFYFEDSTPIPKSIAAIFAWQSSKKFVQDRVRENDFALVVDSFDGGISITPVQAIYQKELDELLPETQGMSWERHPTVIMPNRSIHTAMARNLDRNGCQTSEELLHLFGFDGLASDSGEVSFVKDDHWYHLPGSIREALNQDLDLNILSNYAISDCLNSTNRDCRGVGVFILPLEDTIRKPKSLREKYHWIDDRLSPVEGGQTLIEWQKEVSDIALWRDHLPELSIRIVRDGHFENFYLVKDATVTPQRGRTVNIPVEESFTLPAGQTHYSFPLQQGEGNKELQFVAYLKSPAFPLKEASVCKLKMTYTYGADDPYELKFIPLDSAEAGFKSIRVEWRAVSAGEAADLESLPVPAFPDRKSWSDFQNFSERDGENLVEWVSVALQQLDPRILHEGKLDFIFKKELEREKASRVEGRFEWGAKDKKGNEYCRVKVNEESIFCHSSNFSERISVNDFSEGQPVFLKVLSRGGDKYGMNITFRDRFPSEIERNILNRLKERMPFNESSCLIQNADWLVKRIFSIRFPTLTIWNHGHSLSESDVPDHFRNTIFEGTQKILSIIESENIPDTLKEELFFFLCCLHKDAPAIVGTRLLEAVKDDQLFKRNNKNIAFAIGDAELPWQQELLEYLINPIVDEDLTRSITLQDLAIALWRSKELIFKLTERDLTKLCNDLFRCLQFDIQLLSSAIPKHRLQFHFDKGLAESEAEAERRERMYQASALCKHLELLLALLRSRGSEDERLEKILAPKKDLTKRYVNLIDDVSRIVIDNAIEVKSRISLSLQIKKPEMFSNTPDILYALRMFLTGDSGANSIAITGISDED